MEMETKIEIEEMEMEMEMEIGMEIEEMAKVLVMAGMILHQQLVETLQ